MTAQGAEMPLAARAERVRLVPLARRPRGNNAASVVLAVSLALHAALLLPLVWADKEVPAPVETPVEVIQEPPASKGGGKAAEDAAKAAQDKAAQEKASQEKAAQAKAAQAKADQDKAQQEKAQQARNEQAKSEQQEADRQKAEAAKAEQAKAAQEKAAQEKAAQEKAAQAKAEAQKAEQAKAEQQRAAQEQAAQEKAAQEKAAQEKAVQEKAAQAKAKQDKAEQAKAERQKAAQEKAEQAKAERQAKADQKAERARERAAKQEAKAQPQKVASRPPETPAEVAARMRSLGIQPPGVDATALPGEGPDGTINATYEQLVMSKLTKALSMEQHQGRPGYATVTFVVGDKGEVASVVLDQPSGDPILDGEATAVVQRAAPFPVPPPGMKREYTVTLQSKPVM